VYVNFKDYLMKSNATDSVTTVTNPATKAIFALSNEHQQT